MDIRSKKILYIDLNKNDFDIKSSMDLNKYIGGVGLGLKLLESTINEDPVIFSVGPLNGYFPYCSKTSIVTNDNGVIEDIYIGGSLSSRIKFSGLDSIVIMGKAKSPVTIDIFDEKVTFKPADSDMGSLGLPGKRSILYYDEPNQIFMVDKYFSAPEKILEKKLLEKNVRNIVVTGSKTYALSSPDKYEDLYNKMLAQSILVSVDKGTNPSCIGCPMGCQRSRVGEIGGNVLTHSLVACAFAENIFSDIGITFSCLNFLGYDYTHEDIEEYPELIKTVLQKLN
jgi:aldehyde:ferredoxin oxidoreductase